MHFLLQRLQWIAPATPLPLDGLDPYLDGVGYSTDERGVA